MPALKCDGCAAVVAIVGICKACRKYQCEECGRAGCCGKTPPDRLCFLVVGEPLTREDDDPHDDDTALEPAAPAAPGFVGRMADAAPVSDDELSRWATEGGRIVGEDWEIGGEGG